MYDFNNEELYTLNQFKEVIKEKADLAEYLIEQ